VKHAACVGVISCSMTFANVSCVPAAVLKSSGSQLPDFAEA
jgi:hypothetical protein